MGKVNAVAIAESYDAKTGRCDMIQCLGVFDSYAAAYGEAVIYLSEVADNKDNNGTITTIFDLEGETGYGLSLKNQKGQEYETVFILHAPASNEQQEGGGAV